MVIPLRIDHNLQETTVSALALVRAEEKLRLEQKKLKNVLIEGNITLDRYKQALNQLNREFDEFASGQFDATNGFARFNRAAQGSAQTLKRRFNTGLQQAGFQVGDFAVQVQGGTNAMVALGQQGSQLLGILGPYGAIAGAGLAIGTAILAPLLDSAKAAGNLNRTLKELAERRDELNRETEFLESGLDFKEQVDIRDEILRLEGEIEEAQQRAATSSGRNRRAHTLQIKRLQSEIQELIDLEESYGEALENNRSAEYLKELDQQNLADLARLQGELLLENLKYEEEQKELLELSQKAALDLAMHASNVDFSRPVEQAIKLADALGISVQRALLLTPGAMGNLPTFSSDSRSDAYDSTEAELQRMKEIINQGFSSETDKGSRGSAKQQENNLEKLIKRIQLQKELLGLTEAEAFVLRALGDERSQYTEQQIDAITKETESWMKRRDALEEAKTNQEDFFDSLNSNLESVISGIVSGNKTLAESFADLYLGIADQLFKVLALQHMLNATSGIFSMIPGLSSVAQTGIIGGGAMVDTFSKGGVVERYASGGIVSQSTAFPMANGIGLMGEAGAEAILPLSRDSKGNLGVKSESSPVSIVFYISTPNAESFKKSEAQIASRMSRALANGNRNK